MRSTCSRTPAHGRGPSSSRVFQRSAPKCSAPRSTPMPANITSRLGAATRRKVPASWLVHPLPGGPAADGQPHQQQRRGPEPPVPRWRSIQRPSAIASSIGATIIQPSTPTRANCRARVGSPSRSHRCRRPMRRRTPCTTSRSGSGVVPFMVAPRHPRRQTAPAAGNA